MPLFPLSGSESDQYANLKPRAEVTIAFDEDDFKHTTIGGDSKPMTLDAAVQVVKEAFGKAETLCHQEIGDYAKEMRELYDTHRRSRTRSSAS
jgi:hypothetical protein